jgi:hypothetical protein
MVAVFLSISGPPDSSRVPQIEVFGYGLGLNACGAVPSRKRFQLYSSWMPSKCGSTKLSVVVGPLVWRAVAPYRKKPWLSAAFCRLKRYSRALSSSLPPNAVPSMAQ